MNAVKLRFCTFFAAVLSCLAVQADTYTVSVPDYEANPGDTLVVPVELDNAAGLAEIRIQINFDPEVLSLTKVRAGPLGGQFDMSSETGDGVVTIDFIRTVVLAGGAGRLAELSFLVNPGATTDLYSDLAVARFEIGDDSGVRSLAATNTLRTQNGSVSVSASPNIDNAANGLPDWWELQNGLDPFAMSDKMDDDGDGVKNLMEFALGGDPKSFDRKTIYPVFGSMESDGRSWWTLTFRRRKGPAPVRYILQESSDLVHWASVDPDLRLVGSPVDLGDGMEQITVRCPFESDAPDCPAQWFMRLKVDPQP